MAENIEQNRNFRMAEESLSTYLAQKCYLFMRRIPYVSSMAWNNLLATNGPMTAIQDSIPAGLFRKRCIAI